MTVSTSFQRDSSSKTDIKVGKVNCGASANTVAAVDPCEDKGGTIYNGALEKGLVRVCAFNESGMGSAIGYNDLALVSAGKKTLAVKTFLAKKTVDGLGLGPDKICQKQKASEVKVVINGDARSFCQFQDGSLIETITLSFGAVLAKELAAALK